MALAAFDTLKFVDELEKSGIPEKQARAISSAVRKVHESSDVATKGDIADLYRDTKQDIADLRRDTKQDIADLRRDTKQDIADLRRDFADAEERTDAKLEKLGTELRHEIGDLRKDMEARFAGVDAKLAGADAKLEKAKFDLLKWMVGLAVGNFAFLVGIFWKVMSIPGIH